MLTVENTQISDPQSRTRIVDKLLALMLLVGFFSYYLALSQHVKFNGGPDEEAHYHAARFIAENKRLAVHPGDEAELFFPPAGVTLSFRPPLAYLFGAVTSPLFEKFGIEEKVRFRGSSALAAAIAVLVLFLALKKLTASTWISVFGALTFGLLPQYSFLASYFNDDPMAILIITLLLYCLISLMRPPISRQLLIGSGITLGLVILTKPTAWLVALGLSTTVFYFIVKHSTKRFRDLSLVFFIALLIGGWWITFNIINHGLLDPFNLGIEKELMDKYRTASDGAGLSYRDQGVGFFQLITNYDDFLSRLYKSAVGNLDWLRLEMGILQYSFYGVLLFVAIAGAIFCIIAPSSPSSTRVFCAAIIASLLLQLGAFFWASLQREVQVQGRYVLTVLPLVTIMASLTILHISEQIKRSAIMRDLQGIRTARLLSIGLLISLPIYVHLQGLVYHVLPFYKLPFSYSVEASDFEHWDFSLIEERQEKGMTVFPTDDDSWHIHSSEHDPWLLLPHEEIEHLADGVMLQITIETRANGVFAVYWDEGDGFSERLSTHRHYNIGYQTIYIELPTRNIKQVRIDPMNQPGQVLVHEIAVADLPEAGMTIPKFIWFLFQHWKS
jgi:4-amino-4-deoxy-L-arabinose transferase-like glycosyltransferase